MRCFDNPLVKSNAFVVTEIKHLAEDIESHLLGRAMGLFELKSTTILYDLMNTHFDGVGSQQPKAQRGHLKGKCADCPLLTLGLVLDGGGFVRRQKVFSAMSAKTGRLPCCSQPWGHRPGLAWYSTAASPPA